MTFHVPNAHRIRDGRLASTDEDGRNGAFFFRWGTRRVRIIASDGNGWEHVSVSLQDRCANWQEMCKVKDIFWDEEDCVVQYHPPKSEYVNNHPFVLHLWRPCFVELPRPPIDMV